MDVSALHSAVSLFPALRQFPPHAKDNRELRHQLQALCTTLLLINVLDITLNDTSKLLLRHCEEVCRSIESRAEKYSQVENDDSWKSTFRQARIMMSAILSTLLIGMAKVTFREAAITAGAICVYKELIDMTISDLEESDTLFPKFSLSTTGKEASLQMCYTCRESIQYIRPKVIKDVENARGIDAKEPSDMVFCSAKEIISDLIRWETVLEEQCESFLTSLMSAIDDISALSGFPNTSFTHDIVKLLGLKTPSAAKQKYVVMGKDLTKPDQVIDLCGMLLFYDVDVKAYARKSAPIRS